MSARSRRASPAGASILALMLGLAHVSHLEAHLGLEQQIEEVERLLRADPGDPSLHLRLGELHRAHRDWPAARRAYARARALDPGLAAVDLALGRMSLEAGRPDESLAALDRFLAAEPGHAGGLLLLGRARSAAGDPRGAAAAYDAAIAAAAPDGLRPEPLLERAGALEAAGGDHLAEAVRGLDEGMERLGPLPVLILRAVDLEVRLGRHEAALDRVDRLIEGSPRPESLLRLRGEILEAAGRPAEAREAFARALSEIEKLPAARRGTRAVRDLTEILEAALARLEPPAPQEGARR